MGSNPERKFSRFVKQITHHKTKVGIKNGLLFLPTSSPSTNTSDATISYNIVAYQVFIVVYRML